MDLSQSTSHRTSELRQRSPGSPVLFVKRAIWILLGVIEVILGLRFVLELLGANPSAGFTVFIHDLSGVFMGPFTAVFGAPRLSGSSVVELSVLLAMAVYALVAWGLVALIDVVSAAVPTQRMERLESIDHAEREEQDLSTSQGVVGPLAAERNEGETGTTADHEKRAA